jgi:outer membrane protein OmpA-like peptidoglycan-associated protein
VADGTAADRIDTASGGETNPADTNATSSGQAENRRTELIVLQR